MIQSSGKKFDFENIWVDPTWHRPVTNQFWLILYSALLGMKPLSCTRDPGATEKQRSAGTEMGTGTERNA